MAFCSNPKLVRLLLLLSTMIISDNLRSDADLHCLLAYTEIDTAILALIIIIKKKKQHSNVPKNQTLSKLLTKIVPDYQITCVILMLGCLTLLSINNIVE